MQHLSGSALAAAASHLDRPAVVGRDHSWTWREIHAASIALSRRFGTASAVCNLCHSRSAFLITWLAALRHRCLLVLPPSGGNADLVAALNTATRPVIVVDDPAAIQPPWRDSAECLVYRPAWRPSDAADADLAWEPAWNDTAVLLYTSGSTGTPEPQPKTLLQLATGALVLGQRLSQDVAGGLPAIRLIVCSVPQQHMFGVEASVMLSLVHAIPVLDWRPLLPADVQDAFAVAPSSAWIATPLHLRSLVQSGDPVPNCCVVIASTMPLAQRLAQQAESLVDAPVLEIYGSTETGVVAMRRTAQEIRWRPVDGVRVESTADATEARGSHFTSPVELPDQVDVDAAGHFELLGRQADLIKIGGRRVSLAGLNALLHDMPGLDDGVFYLPATGNPTERLCLIHSGPALDRAATDRWLRARIDPVFLPRTVIRVARLPRSDTGKLPRQALDDLFAQWKAARTSAGFEYDDHHAEDGRGKAARTPSAGFEFRIPADHPALPGHFPGRPVVPGVLLLDRVLTGIGDALQRRVASLQQVRFVSALLPDEIAQVAFECDGSRARFSVHAQRAGVAVALASGSVVLSVSLSLSMPLSAPTGPA